MRNVIVFAYICVDKGDECYILVREWDTGVSPALSDWLLYSYGTGPVHHGLTDNGHTDHGPTDSFPWRYWGPSQSEFNTGNRSSQPDSLLKKGLRVFGVGVGGEGGYSVIYSVIETRVKHRIQHFDSQGSCLIIFIIIRFSFIGVAWMLGHF